MLNLFRHIAAVQYQVLYAKNTRVHDYGDDYDQNLDLDDADVHLRLLFYDWSVFLKTVDLGLLLSCGHEGAGINCL